MTTTIKNAAATSSPAVPPQPGFPTIPTRIRDIRDGQVPPLVVEPVAEQHTSTIRQCLGELSIRLADIHRTAAEAYLSQGLYDAALPHIETAATFAPGDADYQLQLGFVRYVLGDDTGAINAFQAALTTDPANGEAWFNLGMVRFGLQQFAEAEECFRRAIDCNATDAQTWNNRGVCLWQLERTAEARACFQKALQIDPQDADARFNLTGVG